MNSTLIQWLSYIISVCCYWNAIIHPWVATLQLSVQIPLLQFVVSLLYNSLSHQINTETSFLTPTVSVKFEWCHPNGEYLSNKYEIRISPNVSVIPFGAFLQPLNYKSNFATARRSLQNVVNSRPTTVACRSHSASSFSIHNAMTTGCDATRRAVRWCQLRLDVQAVVQQMQNN